MKGGFNFNGLRRSQVSLVLIGFVCATVIFLAWTKTTFLLSLIQPRDNFLRVSSVRPVEDIKYSDGGNNSSQSDIVAHPSNNEREDISPGIKDSADTDKVSEEINDAKLTDNKVPPVNSVSTKAPDKDESSKNITTSEERQGDKEISPAKISEERTNSQDAENGVSTSASSVTLPSSGESESIENVTTPREKQVCNLAKGKWVEDPERPLYSGFGCQQWLSGMWSCRLTQRTDFEYEFLRWQPRDCQMESFSASKFLKRMVNKTLAFVGDSLGRQQFQSLMCMASEGKERNDVLDVGVEYGLVKARGAKRPDGWAYRFPSTNTTILYYWSASLSDLEPIDASDPQTDIAMHLDRPPAFLRRYIHKFDVLVLNTGHHWNRGKLNANRWVMHVGGAPNKDKKIANINAARNLTVHSIISWVDSQLPKYPGLKAFYRSISPRHFFNGDWNTGGTCDNTTPLSGGKEVSKEESSDPLAAEATRGKGVKLLDITALSELRDEGHISRYSIKATPGAQDCLHWCLPGVPDTWNEILFAQL